MEPTNSTLQYRLDGETQPSTGVVLAVGEATSTPPAELSEPLYECVDPDALDAFFAGREDSRTVSFEFNGCRVEVRGTGEIRVQTRQ